MQRRHTLLFGLLVALAGLGMGLRFFLAPAASAQTPTFTLTPSSTARFFPQPITPGVPLFTPSALPLATGCYAPLALAEGATASMRAGVYTRSAPTRSSPFTHYTTARTSVTVLDGPVCADGYNWWRVSGAGEPGWVAEGRPDTGYFLRVGAAADAAADAVACGAGSANRAGGEAELALNTRVRAEPNTGAATLTVAPAGSSVQVLEGPRCDEAGTWFRGRVNVLGLDYEGWLLEGADGITWLVAMGSPMLDDGSLCAAPLPFYLAQRARVRDRGAIPKTLRSAPGTDAPALFGLIPDTPLVIEDAVPVCRENMNWWKVRVLTSEPVIGWISEGSPGTGYWIGPIGN
jgi:uncharacterized protein YraI